MDNVKEATTLLRDTEAKLRGLVSKAATLGDYASVLQIAAWARTLCELVRSCPSGGNGQATQPGSSQVRSRRSSFQAPPTNRLTRHPYPQFFRQGDQLIRLAWSKRERKEYRHKAPHSALKALVKAMAEKGVDGRVFSTDEFLPIRDTGNGDVPNYQAYVGISLLKQTGLIDQHGRQGYSIPRLDEFRDAADAVWKNLPEQQI